ncbi:nitroreductase family deazaflavin-dependent oxidoreductase [Nocardia sp. NPDC050406]|uniref:nitroreductase family deazaflavin-dependent oxidoreductase n=1 Tax=Nocardia sp. NPDC050406 TaxID=3364318 RepID=UPI0037AAC896
MIDLNEWNERIAAEFRSNSGHIRWSDAEDLAAGRPIPPKLPEFEGLAEPPIILLHTIGAKTGRERVSPLMYQPVGSDFAVFATFGGSPRSPAWFHNLLAHPDATVEFGREVIPVNARIAIGAEREQIWAKQIAVMPKFAEFESIAGRQIPVVLLERGR